jgi:hypothetical protein
MIELSSFPNPSPYQAKMTVKSLCRGARADTLCLIYDMY